MSKVTVTVKARTSVDRSEVKTTFTVESDEYLDENGKLDMTLLEDDAREVMFDKLISWDFEAK